MKIDKRMQRAFRSAPRGRITEYNYHTTRAERQEVCAYVKRTGYSLIEDNEFFMRFAKRTPTGGIITTVYTYTD